MVPAALADSWSAIGPLLCCRLQLSIKQIKYLYLVHEIVDLWDVDSVIILAIVASANGLIAKSLEKHLKTISLDGWIKGLIRRPVGYCISWMSMAQERRAWHK